MFKQAILAAGLVLLACTVGGTTIKARAAAAQAAPAEKAPVYTYVSEWTVPRAMWADYKKEDEADVDAMKKGVADGTLISFGTFAVLNHQEGEPTHGSWFSAASMANLMKFLEGLRNAPGATAPVLAASKHWDYIVSSTIHNGHSGTFTNGYLRVARWPAKASSNDPDGKIVKIHDGHTPRKAFRRRSAAQLHHRSRNDSLGRPGHDVRGFCGKRGGRIGQV